MGTEIPEWEFESTSHAINVHLEVDQGIGGGGGGGRRSHLGNRPGYSKPMMSVPANIFMVIFDDNFDENGCNGQ